MFPVRRTVTGFAAFDVGKRRVVVRQRTYANFFRVERQVIVHVEVGGRGVRPVFRDFVIPELANDRAAVRTYYFIDMLGLFQGLPGAKAWRRYLSENAYRDDNNTGLLKQALAELKNVAGSL